MSSIITRGYGSKQRIILRGYGKRIIEKIIEVLPPEIRKILIPWLRRPWQMKVWVAGNPKFLITFMKGVRGTPTFFRRMQIRAVGNLRSSYHSIRQMVGSPSIPVKKTLQIIGSPLFKVSRSLRIAGNLGKKYTKEVLVKGKKAFKRFFEILS